MTTSPERSTSAPRAAVQPGEAELLVTARETGSQITETIDHFAEINNMEDCAVPLDVG